MGILDTLRNRNKKIDEAVDGTQKPIREQQPVEPTPKPAEKPKAKGKCPLWMRPEDCAAKGYK